jgi:hypothetical protein
MGIGEVQMKGLACGNALSRLFGERSDMQASRYAPADIFFFHAEYMEFKYYIP